MKRGALEPIKTLNRVKINENGEPLADIRARCPNVVVMEQTCPYLRETVAEMLNSAQSALPSGYRLRVGTALRTLSMQKAGWDGFNKRMREEHPAWPLSTLRRATNRYFAPYDQPAPPGHCTGGAVDVALLDTEGSALDMTSPTQGWEAAYTWSEKISPEAHKNRMTMVNAMLGAGFSNCREEFWHYSWGDSAWAVRVGKSACPYGLVKPPVAVEASFEGGQAGAVEQTGESAWRCRPRATDGGENEFLIGIFWGEETEIGITVGSPPPNELFTSSDRKEWSPVAFEESGGEITFRITPTAPRIYISSRIPDSSSPAQP